MSYQVRELQKGLSALPDMVRDIKIHIGQAVVSDLLLNRGLLGIDL